MVQTKALRVVCIIILVLLALQFEMGMAINLSPDLKEIPPLAANVPSIWAALRNVGSTALTHAVLGSLLVLLTVGQFVLSLACRSVSIAIIGGLALISVVLAATTGVLFAISGFQNDGYSHGMATNFLATFTFQFVQIAVTSVKLRCVSQTGFDRA